MMYRCSFVFFLHEEPEPTGESSLDGEALSDDEWPMENAFTYTHKDASGTPISQFGFSPSQNMFWRFMFKGKCLEYKGGSETTGADWEPIRGPAAKIKMMDYPCEPDFDKMMAKATRLEEQEPGIMFSSFSPEDLLAICASVKAGPHFAAFCTYMAIEHSVDDDYASTWGESDGDTPLELEDFRDFAQANGISWDPGKHWRTVRQKQQKSHPSPKSFQ